MLRDGLPALVLLLACSCLGATNPPVVLNIPTEKIPVVKTGKDLLKLEPIQGDDFAVRVGIESNKCNLGGGVLVYVAPVGDPKVSGGARTARDGFHRTVTGPVIVEVDPVDRREKLIEERAALEKMADAIAQKGPHYYVCAVQPAEVGKYEVRVTTPGGDVLAKTTLTVADKPAAEWYQVRARDLDPKNKKPTMATIRSQRGIPDWNSRAARALGQGDLPAMMPGEQDASFTIAVRGDLVTAKLDRTLIDDGNDHFLARVWVQGRPVVPASDDPAEEVSDARQVLVHKGPAHFSLRLDMKPLGVKKGDKVTLQLAYCPMGTKDAEIGNVMKRALKAMAMEEREDAFPIIAVSNEVDFRAP